MPVPSESYEIATQDIAIGKIDLEIRTLKNKQQYYDPAGLAESIGISSATWSLFGVIWQSAVVLANRIEGMNLESINVLELGCGIALPGMIAAKRGGNITVSDYHPLAESFLAQNIILNHLPTIKYVTGDWRKPITRMGRFDLVIASDVLYEREHPEQLASFIDCHATENAKVIIVDPKRRHGNKFVKLMKAKGFDADTENFQSQMILGSPYTGKIYTFNKSRE